MYVTVVQYVYNLTVLQVVLKWKPERDVFAFLNKVLSKVILYKINYINELIL